MHFMCVLHGHYAMFTQHPFWGLHSDLHIAWLEQPFLKYFSPSEYQGYIFFESLIIAFPVGQLFVLKIYVKYPRVWFFSQ